MQLLKWFIVPAIVLVVATTLAIGRFFDVTWVAVTFAVSGVTVLYLWRQATYRLSGSVKNLGRVKQSQRIFKTIFIITFGASISLTIGALIVLLAVPAVRTPSGFGMVFTLMVWSFIVKFGAMNVLTHHFLPESRPS